MTGALECMFWEILQKLAELHSTADIFLTTTDGILQTAHTCEDGQLQSDNDRQLGVVRGHQGCWGVFWGLAASVGTPGPDRV